MSAICHACATATATARCTRCKYAAYCGRDCQSTHYPHHRVLCHFIHNTRASHVDDKPLLQDTAFLAFLGAVDEGHRVFFDAHVRLIDMKRQIDELKDDMERERAVEARASEIRGITTLIANHTRRLVHLLCAFYDTDSPAAKATPLRTVQDILTRAAQPYKQEGDDGPITVLLGTAPLRGQDIQPTLAGTPRTYELVLLTAASVKHVAAAIVRMPDFAECATMKEYMTRAIARLDDTGFVRFDPAQIETATLPLPDAKEHEALD